MHAGPIGALDRSTPDPLGHSGGGARRWPRRDDTLGGDDRPGAVRCRVRDGDVGKWHLGSDPENRSPVDFGFDEAVWSPRTADEVLWTMQSYFPNGDVTSRPYAGSTKITVEPQTIYSRKKGEKPEAVSVYDAEWKAGFDRKITGWATDFMQRSKDAGKPFYCYLPYAQVHNPTIPDPEYAGKTKRGNFADILTEMDDFTGVILDKLEELGLAEDTIVVWASDNGPDPEYHTQTIDPDPVEARGTDPPA